MTWIWWLILSDSVFKQSKPLDARQNFRNPQCITIHTTTGFDGISHQNIVVKCVPFSLGKIEIANYVRTPDADRLGCRRLEDIASAD